MAGQPGDDVDLAPHAGKARAHIAQQAGHEVTVAFRIFKKRWIDAKVDRYAVGALVDHVLRNIEEQRAHGLVAKVKIAAPGDQVFVMPGQTGRPPLTQFKARPHAHAELMSALRLNAERAEAALKQIVYVGDRPKIARPSGRLVSAVVIRADGGDVLRAARIFAERAENVLGNAPSGDVLPHQIAAPGFEVHGKAHARSDFADMGDSGQMIDALAAELFRGAGRRNEIERREAIVSNGEGKGLHGDTSR